MRPPASRSAVQIAGLLILFGATFTATGAALHEARPETPPAPGPATPTASTPPPTATYHARASTPAPLAGPIPEPTPAPAAPTAGLYALATAVITLATMAINSHYADRKQARQDDRRFEQIEATRADAARDARPGRTEAARPTDQASRARRKDGRVLATLKAQLARHTAALNALIGLVNKLPPTSLTDDRQPIPTVTDGPDDRQADAPGPTRAGETPRP